MITVYGQFTFNTVKWILNKLSIQINDTQVLLVSLLFLILILCVMIFFNNFIIKGGKL